MRKAPVFYRFMSAVFDAIAEVPISFLPNVAGASGRARRVYDDIQRLAGSDPKLMVVSFSITNSVPEDVRRELAVPEGTYFWRLRTEVGISFRGMIGLTRLGVDPNALNP